MTYLSPYHRELLERRTPCNSFVAAALRSDKDLPCPWFDGVKPMTDAFSQRSRGGAWLEVHGLIELDKASKIQKWIWSAKGLAYRELIRSANLGIFAGLRDFPSVPVDA